MAIFNATKLENLPNFAQTSDQLAIFQRSALSGGEAFMEKLMHTPLKLEGTVQKESAAQDIEELLEKQIPADLRSNPFYNTWISDLAEISKTFCEALSDIAIRFRLGSTRGCKRYHTDNVAMRLLVTYEGTGTEWLPEKAANREAYENGEPNTKIIRDPSAIQFLKTWDIAIFHGGPNGVLHKTPDAAQNQPSILLRLDPIPFEDHMLSGK